MPAAVSLISRRTCIGSSTFVRRSPSSSIAPLLQSNILYRSFHLGAALASRQQHADTSSSTANINKHSCAGVSHSSFSSSRSRNQSTDNTSQNKSTSDEQSQDTSDRPKSQLDFILLVLRLWRQQLTRYVLIVGVVAFVGWTIYSISSWFSNLSFHTVAYWSFWAGLAMGLGLAGVAAAGARFVQLSPSSVYNAALKKVLSDQRVHQVLGQKIVPGKFKCYAREYPDVAGAPTEDQVPLSRKLQVWKPVRMQMVFQLKGQQNNKAALVSCEVEKLGGWKSIAGNEYKFLSLSVDIQDQPSQQTAGEEGSSLFRFGRKQQQSKEL